MRGCLTKIVVFTIIAVGIAGAAVLIDHWRRRAQTGEGSQVGGQPQAVHTSDGYVCEVTNSDQGRIPKKAVIMAANPSVYGPSGETIGTLPGALFATYYVFGFDKDKTHLLIGSSPYEPKTVGWIESKDVLLWNTREGIEPVFRENRPMPLWETANGAWSGVPPRWEHSGGGTRSQRVLRVLGRNGNALHVAMIYGRPDERDWRVTHAWTGAVDVGFDAKLRYFVNKTALHDDIEQLQDDWVKLQDGAAAETSLMRFLRHDLGLRVGPGMESSNPTWAWIQEKVRALNIPIEGYARQPADIQRDMANKKGQIAELVKFLRSPDNWDSYDTGWLPAELVPMGGRKR